MNVINLFKLKQQVEILTNITKMIDLKFKIKNLRFFGTIRACRAKSNKVVEIRNSNHPSSGFYPLTSTLASTSIYASPAASSNILP